MLKQAMNDRNTQQLADAAMMASRQVWLAGLGAATIARRWASKDAVPFFHSLVKQGEVAESTVLGVLNAEIGSSAARAARIWNSTRISLLIVKNPTRWQLLSCARPFASALPRPRSAMPSGSREIPSFESRANTTGSSEARAIRRKTIPAPKRP